MCILFLEATDVFFFKDVPRRRVIPHEEPGVIPVSDREVPGAVMLGSKYRMTRPFKVWRLQTVHMEGARQQIKDHAL